MSKKKVSLIQAIVQLIAIVALFIPISFTRYFSKIGYSIKTYQYQESLFSSVSDTENLVLGILLILASAASLAYFVLYFTTNKPQLRKKYCIAIPCVSLPLLAWSVIAIENYTSGISVSGSYYNKTASSTVYGTSWGFYLICALYLGIVVLELYKHFAKIEEESKPRVSKTTIIQNSSSADELKKYRDLLDQGIITQEEFDAKKKELLNL